jgi:raffinose/stachyose/melibiose transport system permease protein
MNFSYKQQKTILIITFLIIPVSLLIAFSCYPIVKLVQQSFTDWDGMSIDFNFIGLKNYTDIFIDTDIMRAFLNTGAYVICSVILTFLALYIAIIINGKKKTNNFLRSAIFTPYIMNGVAIALMFNFLYNYETSPINILIKNIGMEKYAVKFISESYLTNFALAFVGMWRMTGFYMVIFLGALQSIQGDYYEAAELDGASFFHKIIYIVIPSIKTVIGLNLFLSLNGALQAFTEPFVITKGGPMGLTDTIITKTLRIAFDFNNAGEASAISVLLMIFIIMLVSIQRKIINGKDESNEMV